ncbi:Pentatricopeptide repeat-containing protein [Camellia lanceoleosa]|uniref:Pentatricopeptide repeat-containing protein n=1 Tax=Camellia lanceoleosa TaxID=1840588 RepID=A0ACC0IZ93_9ERIC|nr:Pentatricopeptide repeat-containing protein [Camellia lanceoleosa]
MLSQGSEVLWVYKKMKEDGVEPDLVTYNTWIFVLSKSGRVKEAMKFLVVMGGKCIWGSAVVGKWCTPNLCTYSSTLLQGFCNANMLEKAIELYGVMKEGDMKLETGSFGKFLRHGRIVEAYDLFDYAVESKSLMDVAAYSTLESTLKWLKKPKKQGLAV